jgi:hypothetical protein
MTLIRFTDAQLHELMQAARMVPPDLRDGRRADGGDGLGALAATLWRVRCGRRTSRALGVPCDRAGNLASHAVDGPVAEVYRPLISAATRSRNASRRSHGTMFAACMSSRNCVSVRAIGLMRARAREWP